jgi:hypothetical protein
MNNKRCFIENDFKMSYDDVSDFNDDGINPDKAFNLFIGSASENKKQVLNAIKKYNEIWIKTAFIGSSEVLFTEMLKAAINLKLKDKVIINMFEYRDVAWHLTKEHRELIKLLKQNNIIFLYSDDEEYNKYYNNLKLTPTN